MASLNISKALPATLESTNFIVRLASFFSSSNSNIKSTNINIVKAN